MKKVFLLTGVLLALTAALASAQTLDLGWGQVCPTLATSLVDNSPPCDGTGGMYMLGSLKTGVAMPGVTAIASFIDMKTAVTPLPDFWLMDSGECRDWTVTGALSVLASFTGLSTTTCKNFWGSTANGGFHWYSHYNGELNRGRLAMVFARSPAGNMSATTQYYMFQAFISDDPTGTAGTPCAGCTDPACWVYNQATVSIGTTDVLATGEDVRRWVTWQGGAGTQCPTATPTSRQTWGHVKSLYR